MFRGRIHGFLASLDFLFSLGVCNLPKDIRLCIPEQVVQPVDSGPSCVLVGTLRSSQELTGSSN